MVAGMDYFVWFNRPKALFIAMVLFLTANFAMAYESDLENDYLLAAVDCQFAGYETGGYEVLQRRINISVKNANLSSVLEEISNETGTVFIYDNDLVNVDGVSADFENAELGTVLDYVLNDYDIGYTIVSEDNVVLASSKSLTAKTGRIRGKVTDENGDILPGANVIVDQNHFGAACSHKGVYHIRNLQPGEYTLRASFIGYKPVVKKCVVKAGQTTQVDFQLFPESFQIGGIEVTAEKDIIPVDMQTKTEISAAEIEHFQATNVGDVLSLVPGVQKTSNPGLGKTGQVAVRGDEADDLATFGTLIMVDGIPESNNSNLQFESMNADNNLGKGVDLRTIPADNLQSIEVVSGLPSVKYGDFTSGIINIKTKIGARPNRIKVKTNPSNSEFNFGGGIALEEDALSYNLNIARSERDIRVEGDEYTRYTGQLVYSDSKLGGRYEGNYKLSGQVINDEEEPKGDYSKNKNYNRGFRVGLATWGEYHTPSRVSKLEYNLYCKAHNINSRRSKFVSAPEFITPGGDTISGGYIGAVRTKGLEWNIGGRVDWTTIYYTGDIIHNVLFGTQVQYDANTGEGVIIDSVFNYYGIDGKKDHTLMMIFRDRHY